MNDLDGSPLDQKSRFPVRLNFLLHALEAIKDVVAITDLEENFIYVNKSFLSTYGYNYDEVLGKNVSMLNNGINKEGLKAKIYEATLSGGWSGRLSNRKKDGTVFTVELSTSVVKDSSGKPIALVGVARDMTQSIEAEKKMSELLNKYFSLYHELKDAIYESTPEGKFIDLNPGGMELFKINSREELAEIDIARDLYVNSNERELLLAELESKGYIKNKPIKIKNRLGEVLTVLETSMVVRDSTGKIVSYRGILRDITELKLNEERLISLVDKFESLNAQLINSEKELKEMNASKDKFFSIIAHDLRSPFSALLSFSEFLVEDLEELSLDEIRSFAEKIRESAKSVFSLLENLLQWSRVQTGKMPYEPITFNMHQKVNEAIHLLKNNAAGKNIEVINKVAHNSLVCADEDMVFSVIQNLLSNAIKFTRESGKIIFGSQSHDSRIEFWVKDNGIGIRQEDLLKLFRIDTHFTTAGTNEEKGTGLGLILCKEIIEKNKGTIRAESIQDEGTIFYFSLPKSYT